MAIDILLHPILREPVAVLVTAVFELAFFAVTHLFVKNETRVIAVFVDFG